MGDCHDLHDCSEHLATPSVYQTLDELDFNRGIWQAAVDGDVSEVVRCLEERKFAVDLKDSSGYTALHYASRNGHTDVCKVLLNHGADVNLQTKSGKATALHRAAYCGHQHVVELLLNRGADPSLSDADGMVPLHKAAQRGCHKIVEVLIKVSPGTRYCRDKKDRYPVDIVSADSPKLTQQLQIDRKTDNLLDDIT